MCPFCSIGVTRILVSAAIAAGLWGKNDIFSGLVVSAAVVYHSIMVVCIKLGWGQGFVIPVIQFFSIRSPLLGGFSLSTVGPGSVYSWSLVN